MNVLVREVSIFIQNIFSNYSVMCNGILLTGDNRITSFVIHFLGLIRSDNTLKCLCYIIESYRGIWLLWLGHVWHLATVWDVGGHVGQG